MAALVKRVVNQTINGAHVLLRDILNALMEHAKRFVVREQTNVVVIMIVKQVVVIKEDTVHQNLPMENVISPYQEHVLKMNIV